jgi:hypothetical protein
MRRLIPVTIVLLFVLTLISSCAKRKENLTAEDEKLVPIYAGLLLLSEEYKGASQPDSTNYQSQVDSILSKNGLTREQFSNRLKDLAQSPPVYQQFTEKVRKDLEQRKPKQPS